MIRGLGCRSTGNASRLSWREQRQPSFARPDSLGLAVHTQTFPTQTFPAEGGPFSQWSSAQAPRRHASPTQDGAEVSGGEPITISAQAESRIPGNLVVNSWPFCKNPQESVSDAVCG